MPTLKTSSILYGLLLGSWLGMAIPATAQDAYSNTGPSWSADGTQIGFSSDRGGSFDIYTIPAEGGPVIKLTESGENHFPVWSPDGSLIAFISDRDGETGLFIMNSDGSNTRKIAGPVTFTAPTWSPDGSRIAFQRHVSGSPMTGDLDTEVMVIAVDGSGEENLTGQPGMDGAPAWSPDGEWIAFSSNRDSGGRDRDIYMMRTDGSSVKRVTTGESASLQGWSPQGDKLTFQSRKDGNPELYVLEIESAEVHRLTNNTYSDFYARWSPNGEAIVFTSSPDGSQDIYIMAKDGSGVRRLTHRQ